MRRSLALLLLVPLAALSAAPAKQTPPAKVLAITHVTVVDVTAKDAKSALVRDQTVIVTGDRITALGRAGRVNVPAGAQVIDASGKFLIPGLWDMHAHTLRAEGHEGRDRYEWVFPLLIAHGVTGVRELGTNLPFERINQIRKEILDEKILGPRIGAATARILDGKGSVINVPVEVETADEARRLVREYKQHGMDFIKVYNLLSREVYLAIVDEAKRQKIPVAGHVPLSMTAAEVSDLGQVSIEHNTDIFLSCSRDEAQLRQERKEREAVRTGQQPRPSGFRPIQIRAAETYDERKAAALFARFVRNGTWMCPTIFLSGTHPAERPREGDSRLKYIPAPTQERWRNDAKQRPGILANADERKTLHRRKLEIVGLMHRTGVRLLAGTDIVNPYVYPGFSLHDELELFVEAGLSPLTALRTATVNPAKFLGKEKELGTVERGKLADLVLLDADPLADIGNTRKISAVVANGRFFNRKALDALLAQAEAAANPKSQQEGDDSDRKDIEAIAARWQEAWNSHDIAKLASLVADDADVITVAGAWLKSRKEFEADHAQSHKTVLRESVLTMKRADVRFIRPDVAVAHGEWGITGVKDSDGTARPPQRGMFTWVLEKSGGGWVITAAQNTLVREQTAR